VLAFFKKQILILKTVVKATLSVKNVRVENKEQYCSRVLLDFHT
jgi:hypothetical protein